MTLTVEQRDELLARMRLVATDLVVQVRDYDPHAVAAILRDLGGMERAALIIALAAMVPDDRPADELTDWTHDLPELAKPCSACGKRLPLRRFHKDASNRDGLRADCKDCRESGRKARLRAVAA